MTTESNDNDLRVSETYRKIADETTPAALDRKVLSMAADAPRAGRVLSRAWFRPIAWAATIGLSLAFVLEISQFDSVTEPAIQAEPSVQTDSDEVFEKRVPGDHVMVETVEGSSVREELDTRSDAATETKASSPPAAGQAPAGDAASVSEDFAASDMHLLREAEEQARSRVGSAREPAASSPSAALLVKKERVNRCDESARRSAASWYACIEGMREQGLDEAATLELEALLSDFPDFQIPEGNR